MENLIFCVVLSIMLRFRYIILSFTINIVGMVVMIVDEKICLCQMF